MNGDCAINFSDSAGFGLAHTNSASYATQFSHLNRIGRADANGDGAVNFSDLAGFGQIILGTAPTGARGWSRIKSDPRAIVTCPCESGHGHADDAPPVFCPFSPNLRVTD